MELIVHLAQALAGDVGVDFRGTDAGVAKEFLDDAKVGTAFQEMCGKAVPQHVRRYVASDPSARHAGLDPSPDGTGGKGGTALGEKHIGRGTRLHEIRSTGLEILLHRRHSRAAQRHDAFLVALANDGNKAILQMQLLKAEVAQFTQTQAGSVG